MPRQDSDDRKREKQLREDLERLIDTDLTEINSLVQQAESVLPQRSSGFLNYEVVKRDSDTRAKKIVTSIAEFYLSRDMIKEIPYIRQKNLVDHITVSNLLFQMKTAEHAIIKLLEEIDNGNTHPRTFEVLASLQRSKMEIVKHLAQFMVVMEQNYKNLKDDYRVKKAEEPTSIDGVEDFNEPKGSTQFRGSRALIETLREAVPEHRATGDLQKDAEDVEDVE
jgi:hypothetical protein